MNKILRAILEERKASHRVKAGATLAAGVVLAIAGFTLIHQAILDPPKQWRTADGHWAKAEHDRAWEKARSETTYRMRAEVEAPLDGASTAMALLIARAEEAGALVRRPPRATSWPPVEIAGSETIGACLGKWLDDGPGPTEDEAALAAHWKKLEQDLRYRPDGACASDGHTTYIAIEITPRGQVTQAVLGTAVATAGMLMIVLGVFTIGARPPKTGSPP